jgi:predicted flap endonuclease-1-like 5' DNA nuclease
MAKLSTIEGIGGSYEQKLNSLGIKSLKAFLDKGKTKKGRVDLAEESGISEKLILRWINHADLMRIKGIGGEFSEILEAAGVDTVPELARRNAENLVTKINEVNEEKKLVRRTPTVKMVESWVNQAKELPRVVEY